MTQAWYPFYWSDYSGKTFHLTQGQHGAYFLLLRYIYTTGKPIPLSQAYSIAQATLPEERENVEAVLIEFFKKGDGWTHLRANEIMKHAEEKHKKLVESGSKGGKARSSHPQATLKHTTTTTTTTTKDIAKAISTLPKITLDELSIEHISDWLTEKRSHGVFINHDEKMILESFKDYCRSKAKRYVDYPAALRNAFQWEKHQPKGRDHGKQSTHNATADSDRQRRESLVRAYERRNPGASADSTENS